MGDVFKETQPETPQLAIENTRTNQPKENDKGVLYEVELENTLKNTSVKNGFFKNFYDRERCWMMKGYPIKISNGTEIEINGKKNYYSSKHSKSIS